MCLYIFLGQSFFIKFCRMLGHQTPSKAPKMSNMNPIAYFQVSEFNYGVHYFVPWFESVPSARSKWMVVKKEGNSSHSWLFQYVGEHRKQEYGFVRFDIEYLRWFFCAFEQNFYFSDFSLLWKCCLV